MRNPRERDSEFPEIRGAALDRDGLLSRGFLSFGSLLGRYHRHRVLHMERLGLVLANGRRVVIVCNHALNIVDPLLFVREVLERYGVIPRFIAHGAWFKAPGVREIAKKYRIIPSMRKEAAAEALAEDGLLMLFPGAVREAAVRDYWREPYKLKWEGRTGFLRLALEHDAEIIFVSAVGNDEMYFQSRVPIPERLLGYLNGGNGARYRGSRWTFGLLGLHLVPGLFPLPVQMTHVVSEPIDLGDRELALRDEDAFAALHERVWQKCQESLDRAVARRHTDADLTDVATRSYQHLLHELGF